MGKLIGVSGLLALLAALGYGGLTAGFRMDMVEFSTVFAQLKWLTPALLGTGVLAVLLGLVGLFTGRAGGGFMTLFCGAVALAMGTGPMLMMQQAKSVPAIHDITTDPAYPPVFVELVDIRTADGATNPPEYDADQTADQLEAYPEIKTASYDVEYDMVWDAALSTIEEMGLKVVSTEKNAGRIEATATTMWFGFKDDVVVRVNRFSSPVTVDIRSKSRIGKSDVGANAKRIETFLTKLDTKLS